MFASTTILQVDMIGLSGLITPSLDEMVWVAKEMAKAGELRESAVLQAVNDQTTRLSLDLYPESTPSHRYCACTRFPLFFRSQHPAAHRRRHHQPHAHRCEDQPPVRHRGAPWVALFIAIASFWVIYVGYREQ